MISRRWVLQLGAGTVLSGFHGWAAEEAPLPPGVYGPSMNHLAHALQAASARPPAPAAPQFFTADEFAVMRRVVAVLLGDVTAQTIIEIVNWMDRTLADSGAVRAAARSLTAPQRALAVAYYGPDAVRALETDDPARVVREGLRALGGSDTDQQLIAALQAGGPFYELARRAALDGYYTSREGLKELDYKGNAFYPESPGCSHAADRP